MQPDYANEAVFSSTPMAFRSLFMPDAIAECRRPEIRACWLQGAAVFEIAGKWAVPAASDTAAMNFADGYG